MESYDFYREVRLRRSCADWFRVVCPVSLGSASRSHAPVWWRAVRIAASCPNPRVAIDRRAA